ncbi:MAG: ABC transporter ATP-binding protein/permease [Roseiarcus sp.]|uniref:ABC transporter ATP-binding protein/permease n=1 Tax=Roseiarcus sp. TaxID=1969460 RepID=UPI003BB1DE1B
MRLLSLAVFAVLALVIGAYEEDGMTLMIGGASALAAVASMPSWRLSTFLTILADLFAVETVLFGIADLVALLGYWPHAYEEYELPRYLPLATAIFVIVIFAVSHIPLVRKMMRIADPFFAARTPISIRPWPLPPTILRQNLYARINVFFLILINQFQVAVSLRFNFWQRDFGNAIQVADEAHRVAFWYQLMVVFVPLATIAIVAGIIEFFVASNFVLQWRRWMTASFTSRWLLHSMHYKLALNTDNTDNPDQRISQDVGSFINGSGTGSNSGNVGIYNYTIQLISSATNLVSFSVILWGISSALKAPIFGVEIPGFLFWVAVLYAVVATGITQLIGRSLSKLYFRQQAVEANFRFDLARVREYSEQIALLKGENREIERAGTVFDDVFRTIRRIIHVRTWLIAFNQFYSQISVIIPYVVIAPFYYMKIVDFGRFSQSADAFGNVNSAMNFFVDRYIGLADFSSAIARLTTFEDSFDKTLADEKKEPRLTAAPGSGPSLSFPDVDLALPDGRKLAHIGDLALIPQESALVVGPSGVGKSTLFRAISGLWPFGSGEIQQPAFARLMLLPQRPYIPIGPLRDALAYPAASSSFSDAQLRDALYHVGLPALVERLDESDNWQMRLSGGEQQRLAIARALLAAPDWLFLDESTASLDEESEADLYRAIAKALPNTTLVSIGHRSTLNAFHRRRIAFEPHEGAPATVVSAA